MLTLFSTFVYYDTRILIHHTIKEVFLSVNNTVSFDVDTLGISIDLDDYLRDTSYTSTIPKQCQTGGAAHTLSASPSNLHTQCTARNSLSIVTLTRGSSQSGTSWCMIRLAAQKRLPCRKHIDREERTDEVSVLFICCKSR